MATDEVSGVVPGESLSVLSTTAPEMHSQWAKFVESQTVRSSDYRCTNNFYDVDFDAEFFRCGPQCRRA